MVKKAKITASIVLFNENPIELNKAIESCVNSSLITKLFLIDNSTSVNKELYLKNSKISYKKNKSNLGFGKGHNSIIEEIKEDSDFHLVLNPDVSFNPKIIDKLIEPFFIDKNISLVAPQLVFPDQKEQVSSRNHVNFVEILNRFFGLRKHDNFIIQELSEISNCYYTEFIHGAFLLFRTKDFLSLKGFDPRYFLYLEDADICKQLERNHKKVCYYKGIKATHTLKKGSKKNIKLFFYHFSSLLKYFLKWGFN